ncbi:MAG: hypothetical protein LBK99_07450 [Opitutaceae bacterium]|jgi:hypothetical protein|nr:hypothetical protein [Opitutaceae bacterium]
MPNAMALIFLAERAAGAIILKTSVQATKPQKKPLTTETQRHREKHENQLILKGFLCASVSLWLMVFCDS